MGRLVDRPVLGSVSGKVGGIVFVVLDYMTVVKSLPDRTNKNKKGSPKQQANRTLFKLVGKFFGPSINDIFKIGYQFKGKKDMPQRSVANAYHLLNVVTGEFPDWTIDVTKLKFSKSYRSTENGWNAIFSAPEGGGLDVSWEINPFPHHNTRMDDTAVIILLDVTRHYWLSSLKVQRKDLFSHFKYKSSSAPADLCAWIFFASADGKLVSETKYLGQLNLMK